MSIEPKSRMVSFRLTEEEYHRFRHLCIARGLRNVSEMVRRAVTQTMAEPFHEGAEPSEPPEPIPAQSPDVDSRLCIMESHLAQLVLRFHWMESKLLGNPADLSPHSAPSARSAAVE